MSLTAQGFIAEYLKDDGAVGTNTTPDSVTSRTIRDTLMMAVLRRDQATFDRVLGFAKTKMRRNVAGSGQTVATKLFASTYSRDTSSVALWTVNSGNNLTTPGAAIRIYATKRGSRPRTGRRGTV